MKHYNSHILIIDNEDSFTWNLVQLFEECGSLVTILHPEKAKKIDIQEYTGIVISPGPGLPEEMNGLMTFLKSSVRLKPVLGICLGHQAIAMHFGARLIQKSFVIHGHNETIHVHHSEPDIFEGLPEKISVGLYHSWAVDRSSLPGSLEITAASSDGTIMGIKHKVLPVFGLQFHPESFITKEGKAIVSQWLKITGNY